MGNGLVEVVGGISMVLGYRLVALVLIGWGVIGNGTVEVVNWVLTVMENGVVEVTGGVIIGNGLIEGAG